MKSPELVIAIIGGVMLLGWFFRRRQSSSIKEALEPLARRKSAAVSDGGLWSLPRMEYSVQGVAIELFSQPGSKNRPPYTFVRFERPCGFSFNIYRESFVSSLGKMVGLGEVEIGNAEFDAAYVLKSDSEMRLRQLLSHELQHKLLQLKNMKPSLRLSGERFEMRIPSIPRDTAGFEMLTDTVELLLTELKRQC